MRRMKIAPTLGSIALLWLVGGVLASCTMNTETKGKRVSVSIPGGINVQELDEEKSDHQRTLAQADSITRTLLGYTLGVTTEQEFRKLEKHSPLCERTNAGAVTTYYCVSQKQFGGQPSEVQIYSFYKGLLYQVSVGFEAGSYEAMDYLRLVYEEKYEAFEVDHSGGGLDLLHEDETYQDGRTLLCTGRLMGRRHCEGVTYADVPLLREVQRLHEREV